MKETQKIHDGLSGGSDHNWGGLGLYANPSWFWLPGIIGALSWFKALSPVFVPFISLSRKAV